MRKQLAFLKNIRTVASRRYPKNVYCNHGYQGSALLLSLVVSLGCAAIWTFLSSAASASTGTCSNEILRSELHSGTLPDCRAYELVTPAYKQGSAIAFAFAVSEDGSRLFSSSFGAFAGAEEDGNNLNSKMGGVAYEFARMPTGWVTRSIAPPASEYQGNGMYDASPELNGAVWELGRRSQPVGLTDFYLESIGPTSHTFSRVGPATPNSATPNAGQYLYAGTAADLSHILFSIQEPSYRWPFDSTVGRVGSLYEYVGIDNTEPMLVGVKGGRGNRELIGQCGTSLGSSTPNRHKGSMYNAISPNGDRIFFTVTGADHNLRPCSGEQPPVDELLAREETPSGEELTVPISEPSLTYCSESPQSPCADARFEGASRDGSKVFFTSTQKLLAKASEGSMNLYEYDFTDPPGERLLLLSSGTASPEVQGVMRISEDGSHIYFVAKGVLATEPNSVGDYAISEADNLYAYADGSLKFVATLSPEDSNGFTTRDWSGEDARPVLTSQDGDYLVFPSVADLTHEGTSANVRQLFRYEAQTNTLIRVSIGQNGYNDNGREPVYSPAVAGRSNYSQTDSPSLSSVLTGEDGTVYFESPTALTPQALNNQLDAYENEPIPNVYEYREGTVYLLSDGQDTSTIRSAPGVVLLGSNPSGSDRFFMTSDSLVAQDTDTQRDIYDARVDGGFPAPVAPSICFESGCQEPPNSTPQLPAPGGSAAQTGEGNLAMPATQPSGKQKTKPKKKTKRKHRKKLRSASSNRRGHVKMRLR